MYRAVDAVQRERVLAQKHWRPCAMPMFYYMSLEDSKTRMSVTTRDQETP